MTVFPRFCSEGSATGLGSVGPDRLGDRTGILENRRPVLEPAQTCPNSPASLIFDIFLLFEYAGNRPGGMWLSPTSRLGTGGFLYPVYGHQFHLFCYHFAMNSKGTVDRPKGSALNWYV